MTLTSDARAIALAGIRSAQPERAVRRSLRVGRAGVTAAGAPLLRRGEEQLLLVSLGKAALGLARAAQGILGRRVSRGIVVGRAGTLEPLPGLTVLEGGHPLPTTASVAAGRAVLDLLEHREDLPVLFLVSGGASAIVDVPAEGVSLRDLVETTRLLLGSGAPIQAANALRRHLSRTKGGGLALAAGPGRAVTLAISDVVGDTPWDIASGPTVGDPTRFFDAVRASRRYGIWSRLPGAVRLHLTRGQRGEVPETPKPGDPRLVRHRFRLIGSNRIALDGAAAEARRRGYAVRIAPRPVVGDTYAASLRIARQIRREHASWAGRFCLLSGGETTVVLPPRHGRGGRNQEFALAAAPVISGLTSALVLSAGTDGIDGPTDAAGGWVEGTSLARARAMGLSLDRALATHSSYYALSRLGSLWKTGPTGTNVSDLHVALAGAARRQSRYGRK